MFRCDDCLRDFEPNEERFAVLKKVIDLPEVDDPKERRMLEAMGTEPRYVCADCAGWYGDHPIPMTAAEAQQW